MVLTIKQKALLITAGMIAGAFLAVGALVLILKNVPAEVIGNAFLAIFVSWMIYLLYQITLNRLEYQESLKKLSEDFNKKV